MAPSRKRKLLFLAAPIAMLASIVACNNIIGLTDFDKGECPGARCAVNEGGTDGGPDADSGRDGALDAKGAAPVTWAKWKMPNYDGGPDVFLPNQPKLTTDGTIVTDGITGLAWRNAVLPTDSNSVAGATKQCADLAPAGDWRLPKRIELVTLLDYSQSPNKIDPAMFPLVANAQVWTGSDVQPVETNGPRKYWIVNFGSGSLDVGLEGNFYKVLCVKAR